jgi:hypothetical protein
MNVRVFIIIATNLLFCAASNAEEGCNTDCGDEPAPISCLNEPKRCKLDFRCVPADSYAARKCKVCERKSRCNNFYDAVSPKTPELSSIRAMQRAGACYRFEACASPISGTDTYQPIYEGPSSRKLEARFLRTHPINIASFLQRLLLSIWGQG